MSVPIAFDSAYRITAATKKISQVLAASLLLLRAAAQVHPTSDPFYPSAVSTSGSGLSDENFDDGGKSWQEVKTEIPPAPMAWSATQSSARARVVQKISAMKASAARLMKKTVRLRPERRQLVPSALERLETDQRLVPQPAACSTRQRLPVSGWQSRRHTQQDSQNSSHSAWQRSCVVLCPK